MTVSDDDRAAAPSGPLTRLLATPAGRRAQDGARRLLAALERVGDRAAPLLDALRPTGRALGALGARIGRGVSGAVNVIFRWDAFRFTSLSGRLAAVSLAALMILLVGAFVLTQLRAGLIEWRIQTLTEQGRMMAASLRAEAVIGSRPTLDWIHARDVLLRLAEPMDARAQLYEKGARLIADTAEPEFAPPPVETAPIDGALTTYGFLARLAEILDRANRLLDADRPIHAEAAADPIARDPVVYGALAGEVQTVDRYNSENELIITVAVPVTLVKAPLGVIVLSTKGGDIDRLISEERHRILNIFGVAAIVMLLMSVYLGFRIAEPIRSLARAAERGSRPLSTARVEIPDFTGRADEIGDLSGALQRMTRGLYERIDSTERFAADVAHELKNPLSSLASAIESLRSAKRDTHRERLLNVIAHDVRRLDRLVTDISNASRLDAELVREERAAFDLKRLLETVVDISAGLAEKRAVAISLEASTARRPGAFMIRGLESRLAQVFHNLLDNAVSFSPEGGRIAVTLEPVSTLGGGPVSGCRVRVVDGGPGVPPESLEAIFGRFYTQRPESEAFGQHSGLGLNIARQIVDAHGGRIYAENRVDAAGAMFVVELPL